MIASRAAMTSKTSACLASVASTMTLARNSRRGAIRRMPAAASSHDSNPVSTHSTPVASSPILIQESAPGPAGSRRIRDIRRGGMPVTSSLPSVLP